MNQEPGKKRNGIVVCLGSGQAVALVLVSLAMLGLSFSLGMRAGRSLPHDVVAASSIAQGNDRLGDLDAKADARRAEAEKKAEATMAPNDVTTAPPSDQSTATAGGADIQEAPRAKDEAQNGASAPQAAVKTASQDAAKADGPATTTSTASSASSAPVVALANRSGFALQTSSLPSEKAAQDEVKRLEKRGLSAWYTAAEVKGATTYRVKVGPYETKDDAMKDFDRVTEKAGGKPMVANAD